MAKTEKTRDPEAVKVGRRVRLARQGRQMTLEQLAEAAETSVQFLSQVEKGEQNMTTIKFGKLAKALRVSSDYLLYGKEGLKDMTALAADFLGEMNPFERFLLARVVLGIQGLLEAIRPEGEK